jgi:hypothetical protein
MEYTSENRKSKEENDENYGGKEEMGDKERGKGQIYLQGDKEKELRREKRQKRGRNG